MTLKKALIHLMVLGLGSWLLTACGFRLLPSKINYSQEYNDLEGYKPRYAFHKSPAGHKVFFLLDPALVDEQSDRLMIDRKFVPVFEFFTSHADRRPLLMDTLQWEDYQIFPVSQGVLFTFEIDLDEMAGGLALLSFQDKVNEVSRVHYLSLPSKENTLELNYMVTYANGMPIMEHYANCDDTLVLRNIDDREEQLFVTYYSQEFRPAAPPMAVSFRSEDQQLAIDTTFAIALKKPFMLTQPGLYLFQKDTNDAQGFSIRVGCYRFPRPSRSKELIDPLIYITTTDERAKIIKAVNPKRELDNFWLAQGGNREFGRQMIRNYYRRVEFANLYFTTYKEGWKTDRGLVYTVFGPPSKVRRFDQSEEWEYSKKTAASEQRFVFVRKPNLFSAYHFELVRQVEYDIFWYSAVEQIRKGLSEEKK
jgi:GWxTD domain-containing protein